MTKEILLTQGQVAIVDDEDYKRISQWKWSYRRNPRSHYGYAYRGMNGHHISMHRLIMNAPDDLEVDHIDRNGLNNCRFNLRLATRSQQRANQKRFINNKSGYKGVIWRADRGKWAAQIMCNKIKYRLGCFEDRESAARAYDKKAKELFGEFARLNFDSEI